MKLSIVASAPVPSMIVGLVIDRLAVSLLRIVAWPWASPITTREASVAVLNLGADRLSVKVSSFSTIASSLTATVTVVEVEPAAIVASTPPSAE